MSTVTAWSASARRKLDPDHPAYAESNPRRVNGQWYMTRECECGTIYTKPMEQFEAVSWDDRGVLAGICDTCSQEH